MKSTLMGDEENTRSGLFFESIRIIKEMRQRDKERQESGGADVPRTGWLHPRFTVYENVPGAYSSNKGLDFKAVLEETIRVVEPEAPDLSVPKEGWHECGVVTGDGWQVAWNTHDAQFFGVPQRRKRISLVADYGGTAAEEVLALIHPAIGCPGEVSPECESLPGNSEQSGEEGQAIAGGTAHRPFESEPGAIGFDAYNQMATGEQSKPLSNAATDSDHVPVTFVSLGKNWDGDDQCFILTANNANGAQRMPDKENLSCILCANSSGGGVTGTIDGHYYLGCGSRGGKEREFLVCS